MPRSNSRPQKHGGVALLPCIPIRLFASKTRVSGFVPRHLGDHLKCRRLTLKLTQEAAARRMKVSLGSLSHWENGHEEPLIETLPVVFLFLGYDPYPPPRTTLRERMYAKRRASGWSQKAAAREFGVNERTWRRWEEGIVLCPGLEYLDRLEAFLKDDAAATGSRSPGRPPVPSRRKLRHPQPLGPLSAS
jgi:transcriptional regulator with XRE-family HTH domain